MRMSSTSTTTAMALSSRSTVSTTSGTWATWVASPDGPSPTSSPLSRRQPTLLDVKFNVGRTGSINPFAVLEPVYVGGATVRQATLHNEDYIKKMRLKVGDKVVVERAGEVIPQVVEPLEDQRGCGEHEIHMPTMCPSCDQPIVHREGEAMSYCVNASCPAQLVRLTEHFVSRGAMDIEGLGVKQGQALIDAGILKDVADIYTLSDHREELLAMERMAEKSVSNLLDAVEKSKSQPLTRVLVALGIEFVGGEVAAVLARHFGSMDEICNASKDKLVAINMIGPKIAQSVLDYFENPANTEVVKKLVDAKVNMTDETASTAGVATLLEGKRFVVTGRLNNYSRSEIQNKIKELGGTVSGSLSKRTDYLVVGEGGGSKLADANKLEVDVLTEDGFESLIATPTKLPT